MTDLYVYGPIGTTDRYLRLTDPLDARGGEYYHLGFEGEIVQHTGWRNGDNPWTFDRSVIHVVRGCLDTQPVEIPDQAVVPLMRVSASAGRPGPGDFDKLKVSV
jgi:hypothetical protein